MPIPRIKIVLSNDYIWLKKKLKGSVGNGEGGNYRWAQRAGGEQWYENIACYDMECGSSTAALRKTHLSLPLSIW